MAQERLAPDALLTQTNLTGAVTDIDDDPDSADANWLTAPTNVDTTCEVSFPSPSDNLNADAELQEFRVQVRKNSSRDATVDLFLAMEYIPGANLQEIMVQALRQQKIPPVDQAK